MAALAAGPAYPLKTVPGQHYVADQNGNPFFIQGDSPWYVTEDLGGTNVDYYMSTRAAQGYNSIILDISATPNPAAGDAPSYVDLYGQAPFTGVLPGPCTNLLTWNNLYYTNVDYVLQRASNWGLCCFVYPLYDGYDQNDWYPQMAGNPTSNLFQFGAFIGARYASYSNIVWIGCGDDDEPGAPSSCLWNYVAAGIKSQDTNHLITAQAQRPTPASYYSEFITLNCTYPSCYNYIQSLQNYQMTPVLASFCREPNYENYPACGLADITPLNERQFDWWAVTSGDAGFFWGNFYQWQFLAGWQAQMFDVASTTIPFIGRFMTNRAWYNFVPDANHTVVTSGYGTSGTIDYITTARESHGYTVVSYFPQDQMTATVAMTNIAGAIANAWW